MMKGENNAGTYRIPDGAQCTAMNFTFVADDERTIMPDPIHPNVRRAAEVILENSLHGSDWHERITPADVAADGVHKQQCDEIHGEIAELIEHHTRYSELVEALRELLRVDDEWHGSVNSEMAHARGTARGLLHTIEQGGE